MWDFVGEGKTQLYSIHLFSHVIYNVIYIKMYKRIGSATEEWHFTQERKLVSTNSTTDLAFLEYQHDYLGSIFTL